MVSKASVDDTADRHDVALVARTLSLKSTEVDAGIPQAFGEYPCRQTYSQDSHSTRLQRFQILA